ncbi:MAG: Ig-like domain-containing protein [Clostridia bacterium]|nr:Ig-like domain-containing protein [Clostridia bacterium]
MKRLLPLLLTAILLLTLLPGAALAENKFYFDKTYNTVMEGEMLQLVLIREGDCADDGQLTFTSSNKRAVTVDEDGFVYGVGKGTATITATLKGYNRTWTAKLTVTCARGVTEVRVNEDKLSVYGVYDPLISGVVDPWGEYGELPVLLIRKGKQVTISATLYPTDATNRKWQLTTSDANVARVSGTTITGRAAGECLVTVQSVQNPDVYTAYHVLVVEPVTKVKVTGTEKTIYVGETLVLDATVTPANATIQGVTWSSSREDNASVDAYGVVYGVSKGDAVITARAADGSGQYATYTVTVKQQPESITLNKDVITLKTGNYQTLTATVLPSTTDNKSVNWYSSDESVAKVSTSGRVTAVSPGTAIITCESKTHNYVYAQAVVNVYQPVTKLSFIEKNPYVAVGESITLSWEIGPDTATDTSVTLSTNKESVLEVHQDGTVIGLKRGEAYVYVTANDGSGKKASIKVTVTQPVEGVEMKYDQVSVGVGSKVTNTAQFTPSDASITSMTWYSADPNIATVSGTGSKATVTGRAWGDTTIIGVTDDGSYVTTFDVSVGNLDEALVITNLYVEDNDTIRIVTYNQSNLVITRFYYEIELYDAWGNPLDCNYRNHSNMFEGSNKNTIYPGESLGRGTYSFGSEFSRPWGIGKVVMTITGYETEDGTSRYIRQENRVERVWEATVMEEYGY